MAEKAYPPGPHVAYQPPPTYGAAQPAYPGYPPQNEQPGYPGYPPQPGYQPQQPGYQPQQPGYAPQQPGYPPQGQPPPYAAQTAGAHVGHHTTVVISQPAVTTVPVIKSFGELPMQTVCPQCHAQVVTSTHTVDGTLVWLLCVVMFFLVIWPCCLIPFCITGLKDVHHTCPNCHRMIGVYRRM